MNTFFNVFSGKTYTKNSSGITDTDGNCFVEIPNGYLSQNGNVIQRQAQGFMNMTTGVQSTFGDPFEDKE